MRPFPAGTEGKSQRNVDGDLALKPVQERIKMDKANTFLWKDSFNSYSSDMKGAFIKDSLGLAPVLRMHRTSPAGKLLYQQ